MPRTKEISEDLRLRIVDLHKAGKGYKSISKSLDVQSTVRQIIYKWRKFSTVAALPRSGRPAKMTTRAQCRMLNDVKKCQLKTYRNLCNMLTSLLMSLRYVKRWKKPLLSKKNIAARLKFAKVHMDVPHRYWQNILWTDETKVVLFGRNT